MTRLVPPRLAGRVPARSRARARGVVGATLALAAACAGSPARAGGGLTLTASALRVTATDGAGADVALDLSGEASMSGVPFLAETSFGSIATVEEIAAGRYASRLSVPPTDMPRVAVVLLSPQGRPDADLAWRLVPVRVTTRLAARTEPRAAVTARVGSREFGPAFAGRDGHFTLDIELAPGDLAAEVRITDVAGNVTTSTLRVPVRAHDPLTVTLDRYRVTSDGLGTAAGEAGERGASSVRVFALAFDATGRPLREASLSASASVGEISAFDDRGDGVHVARWTPPADGSVGIATIDVALSLAGQTHREAEQVSIVRGQPGSLRLTADPTSIVAGADTIVSVVAEVKDGGGHALSGQPLRMLAERGVLSELVDRGDGTYQSTLKAPAIVESGTLEIRAILATGSPDMPPAHLELTATPTVVPTSWRAFSLVTAKVTDERGEPVTGELILFHLARGDGRLTPISVTLAEGQAFADFSADPTAEFVTIEATSTSVPSLKARVQIEKRATGQFAIITRPAQVAQGGRASAAIVLPDDRRVLQDSVVLELRAGAPSRLVASADPSRLPADGASTSSLRADLTDDLGNAIIGETLAWAVDRGSVAAGSGDGEEGYDATFTAPDGAGPGAAGATVVVTHAASGLSASVPIGLDTGPPRAILLASDRPRMPADGTSRAVMTATLTDGAGSPVRNVDVRFSVADGDASISPSAMTGAGGIATADLVAGSEAGPVIVRAEAAGGGLVATAVVELEALGPAFLEVAASPERILADGRERAEITVRLEDALGGPMDGEPIELTTSLGTLSTRNPRSDATGIARAWLTGTTPGDAVVRARSVRRSSLFDDVEVELLPITPLDASFDVGLPSCAGAVALSARSQGASAPPGLEWQWEWTGDGVADGSDASLVAPLPAGTQHVRLTITDSFDRTATSEQDVEVLPAPTALGVAVPASVGSGESVRLDAGGSTAPGGGTLTFAWDLDEDGVTDATTPVVADWRRPDGRRVARVTVTDAAGCTAIHDVVALFGRLPDLVIDVSVVSGATQVSAGEIFDYEIAWRNTGIAAADNVRIVSEMANVAALDPLPAGAVRQGGGGVELRLGTIAPGASGSFRLRAQAASSFPATTVVASHRTTIDSTSGEASPSDNADAAFVTVFLAIDLAVSISAPSSLACGEDLAAIVTVANLTGSAAPGVGLDIEWDAPLLGAASFDAPATVQAARASFDLGTIAGNGSVTLRMTSRVPSMLPDANPTLTLRAGAWHAGIDVATANNSAVRPLALVAEPDLSIGLAATAIPNPAGPGGAVEYRATYSNGGCAPAQGAIIRSTTSPSIVGGLLDNPDRGILSGDVVTFDLGTVPPGMSGTRRWTIRLVDDIDASVTSLRNDATIDDSASGLDATPGDNVASVSVPVDPGAPALDVGVIVPASARVGETVFATIVATNTGARASGVKLVLSLAGAATRAGSANWPVSIVAPGNPLVLEASIGDIATGQTITWRQNIVLPCPQPAAGALLDVRASARIGAATVAVAPAASTLVTALPDLALTLAVPSSARPGESAATTATVTNAGCAPCMGGTLTMTWPPASATGSPAIIALPRLDPGQSVTLPGGVVDVRPIQPAVANVVAVSAAVSCADGDSGAANDGATAQIAVPAAPDVAIREPSVLPALAAGDSVGLTVQVDNMAGSTDALDVDVSLVSLDAGLISSIVPSSVRLPILAAGGSAPVSFTVTAAPALPSAAIAGRFEARASVPGDSDLSDNVDPFDLPLAGAPDLRVTMSVASSPSPPQAGATIAVDVDVLNHGSAPSPAPVLELDRDSSLLLAIDPGQGTDLVSRSLAPIAPGQTTRVTFEFLVVDPVPPGVARARICATGLEPLDPDPSDNGACDDVVLDPAELVDVAVEASIQAPPDLRAGGRADAALRVSNPAPRDATGVVLTATWDPAIGGGTGTMSWGPMTVPAFEPGMIFPLPLDVPSVLPDAANVLRVDAALSLDPIANPQIDLANDSDSAQVAATAEAQLCVSLAATAMPSPAVPGGSIVYDLDVINSGSTAAAPATVTLRADPRLVPAGARGPWTLPGLPAGASASWSVPFTIPALLPGETTAVFSATADATAPQAGPPCLLTPQPVDIAVTTLSDLAIDVALSSSSDTPPRRGTLLDYRITVTNVGTQPAIVDRVEGDYPSETTFVSAGGPGSASDAGGIVTWTGLAPLAPLGSLQFLVQVRIDGALPTGAYVLRHAVRVFNAGMDASAGNDRDTHDLPMALEIDLEVVLTATPASAVPGAVITYGGAVSNRGSYPANNVHVDVDLGPFATAAAGLPGGGSGPFDLSLGRIDPGMSVPLSFSATSNAVMDAERSALVATACARADEPDPIPSNDCDDATTWIDARVDLDVHVSCTDRDGAPLLAGDQLDCDVTIHDHGSLVAAPVDVAVNFDATLAGVALAGPFGAAGAGRLTATLPSVSPAAPASLAFSLAVASVLPAEQNVIGICATASCPFADRFPSDNTRCLNPSPVAIARPDLVVTFDVVAPTNPATPGQALDCSVVVRNAGSTGATGVGLEHDYDQAVIAGLLPGSGIAGIGDDGDRIGIPVGSLAAGASFTANYRIGLAATMPAPTGVAGGTACATLDEIDANPADNCDGASIPYAASVDACVGLATVSSVPVAAGQTLTLQATWSNSGQAPAIAAVVDVSLSSLARLGGCAGCVVTGPDTIRFAAGDLAPGASSGATFDVVVDSVLPDASNVLGFVATIRHANPASEAGPCADTASLDVEGTAAADLAVTLTRTSPDPVPGDPLTYDVAWTNQGTTMARGVTLQVTDSPFVELPPRGWNALIAVGDVAVGPGGSGSTQLAYQVVSTLPDTTNTLTTSVEIRTTTLEAGPGPNIASWSDDVGANPDFWTNVGLEPDTFPFLCGGTLTADVVYGNRGEAAASADLLVEFDAAVTSLVDPAGGNDLGGGRIQWSFASIAAGATSSVRPVFRANSVLPAVNNPLFFESTISTTPGLDSNPPNDYSRNQTVAVAAPDLVVAVRLLSAAPSPATTGSVLTYELAIENIGCTRATSVQLEARWESAALVASAACDSDPSCAVSGNLMTWDLGSVAVAPGSPITRIVSLTVAALLPAVSNTLTVTGTATLLESDPNAGNNTAAVATTITGAPDLRLALSSSPAAGSSVVPGTTVTYQYGISNAGNAPAENVLLTGTFDAATLSFRGGGTGSASGSTLTFPPIASVPPATTVTPTRAATFVMNDLAPPPIRRTITHSALVQEAPPIGLSRDANPSDNSGSLDLVGCYITLAITNSATSSVCMGGSASLHAKATPSGLSYAWSVDGGTGAFTSLTASSTTFTPPVTAAGATYRVRCRVTDAASGCYREEFIDVQTTTACVACGCKPTPVKVRYDGQLSRVDRPGDQGVIEGETVAFRVQVHELNNSRSSTVLAGLTTISFGKPGGGPKYTASLVADVYIECNGYHVLEFAPAVVPAGLVVGGVPTAYQAKFDWVTRDACESQKTDSDDSAGDRITVNPTSILGLDPGITFTDWGPERRP